MKWSLSHVIHMWRLTCMHQQLTSCASSWKMMMEHTKHIWRGGFRTCSRRPGKSPNTGWHAAALTTQSFTIRRFVFFLWFVSCYQCNTWHQPCSFVPQAWILLLHPQFNMMGCVVVCCQGGRWQPFETMESFCGGGSATISSVESGATRAPPVGCWPATVESVRDTGQADGSVSVRPKSHAPSPQPGLCRSQVSDDRRKTLNNICSFVLK